MRIVGMRAITFCALLVLAALAAPGAASALPSWSPQGPVTERGSVTVTTNGRAPITCPSYGFDGWAGAHLLAGGIANSVCSNGGTIGVVAWQEPSYVGGQYYVKNSVAGQGLSNPFGPGQFGASNWTAPFYNAGGGQPSRIVFNNTVVGVSSTTGDIRVTGTIPVKVTGTSTNVILTGF